MWLACSANDYRCLMRPSSIAHENKKSAFSEWFVILHKIGREEARCVGIILVAKLNSSCIVSA